LRSASKTHLRGVNEHFLTILDDDDLEVIERTMSSVARQAGGVASSYESSRCAPDAADTAAMPAGRSSGGC
jgi:hypothetical protein